ncbi:hypothetical protein PAPHI01_2653, partial [Pancytospora philotis]
QEFLAVAWGIKHFDYHLRGRPFKVRTDHSALTSVKTKETFGNDRLERMREELQEYDFEVEYVKGTELIEADAISRIYEEPSSYTEYEMSSKCLLRDASGAHFWKLRDGSVKVLPQIAERIDIIAKAHVESTGHRGREAVMKVICEKYYWPNLQDAVGAYIRSCDACCQNRQKTAGGETFITTARPLELAAVDLFFPSQKQVVLTFIDFYTRLVRAVMVPSKSPSDIVAALRSIFADLGYPLKLVADNGREFTGKEMKAYLADCGIVLHPVSSEKHQSG